MNEINFEIQNVEKIDLSMDVGVKEIYPPIENLEVTPTKEQQIFTHENSYGYDNVTVNPIPEIKLQDKDITINENGIHSIVADDEYDGLNQVNVTVDAIEDLTEELETYNTELTTQETTIDNLIETLKNKGIGKAPKYAPRYMSQPIKFQSYTGSELEQEVSGLDTTNFTDMSYMFNDCRELTSLDLSGWNTKNVKNMSYMFSNASYDSQNLVLDISGFNTSKVTNMSGMFRNCGVVSLLGLSNFDTSNVTNMQYMFRQCQRLTELDLSNFNTSNVTNMAQMFYNSINLKKLDIRNFTFDKVTSYDSMFGQSNSGPIPTDCLIIVKSETEKEWVLARRSDLTNVKTVAEL